MIPDAGEKSGGGQSGVRQALTILRALGQQHPMTFSALLHACGNWPKATLTRILKPLLEMGWVEKTPSGAYAPGSEFQSASAAMIHKPSFVERLRPVVDHLAEETGQSAAYVEWVTGGGFIFKYKKEMPDSFHHLGVGETNPAILTHAFGILGLAFQSDSMIDRMLQEKCDLDPDGIVFWRRLLRGLRQTRFLQHLDYGLRFAAPVFEKEGGPFCGVIGISMIPRDLTTDEELGFRDAVLRAAIAAQKQ